MREGKNNNERRKKFESKCCFDEQLCQTWIHLFVVTQRSFFGAQAGNVCSTVGSVYQNNIIPTYLNCDYYYFNSDCFVLIGIIVEATPKTIKRFGKVFYFEIIIPEAALSPL